MRESSPQTRRSVAALPQSRLCVWTAARPLRTRTPRHAALPCVLHYLHVQAISYHLSGGRSVMFALARSVGEWKLLQWAKVEQLFGPAVAEPPTAEAPTTPRRFARASWRVCDGVSFEVRTPSAASRSNPHHTLPICLRLHSCLHMRAVYRHMPCTRTHVHAHMSMRTHSHTHLRAD